MAKDTTIYAPIHLGIWDSLKLVRLCASLGVEDTAAVGMLASLWLRTANHSPEGVLWRITDLEVEHLARWRGEPGRFVPALLAAGFAHRGSTMCDGCRARVGELDPDVIVLHEWEHYTGWGLARRAAERTKKRLQRGQPEPPSVSRGQNHVVPGTSPGRPPTDVGLSPPTGSGSGSGSGSGEIGIGRDREREGSGSAGIAPAAPEPPPSEPEAHFPTPDERADHTRLQQVARIHREAVGARRAKADALTGRPQTADELLAWDPDGQGPVGARWAARFPALDGQQGRPSLRESVENLMVASCARPWGMGAEIPSYAAWWVARLGEDHTKARRTYDRDKGTPQDAETREKAPVNPEVAIWRSAVAAGQTTEDYNAWSLRRYQAELRGGKDDGPPAPAPTKPGVSAQQAAIDAGWREFQREQAEREATRPAPAPPPEPPPDPEPKAPRLKRAISPEARADLERARAELGQGPRQDRGKRGSGVPAVGSLLGDVVGNQGGQDAV